mgnify:FL=1
MESIVPTANAVKVKKWLTPGQSQELRSAIYAKYPQLVNNVQIVSTGGKVQMSGINGFFIDPAIADAVTCLIEDFGTTPETEETAALSCTLLTAATMQSHKRTIRQRSSDGKFLKKHCKLTTRRSSDFNEMLADEAFNAA